jgi:PglZ domain
MHAFHNYLAGQLDRMLREDRVVVLYDSRCEFGPFLDELQIVGPGLGDLPRIAVHDTLAHLARYEGSFFALRAAIEPVVAADRPDPLLIYVPGVDRDRLGSVLMELECAGTVFGEAPSHALKSQARRILRKQFTDGDIDEMLAPESLTYSDVVGFLGQEGSGSGSLLQLVLGSGPSERILSKWLANDQYDEALESKLAQPELFKLVNARLGFEIESGTTLAKARHQTLRYVLVNEFRADLGSSPPKALELVPEPSTREAFQRIGEVAARLRDRHGDDYVGIANTIEQELGLAAADLDPAILGAIDTFRFEERRLLGYAASLVADGHHADALDVVLGRRSSFWVDHPSFLGRLAQWEACRLMAELGQAVAEVRPKVKKMSGAATRWVEAYAAEDGWFCVDRAQRTMESWVAKMEDEPEEPLERAIGVVRRDHEGLLKEMAKGFTKSLVDSEWTTSGVLQQTHIYPDLVEARGGKLAYFFVDAMRYEMGADLVEQLDGGQDVLLQPAVTVLPSITPMGMAALLPGSSSGFSLVDHKAKLTAQIGDSTLPDLAQRTKHLKAIRPDALDIDLGELLQKPMKAIKKKLGASKLIVVRSQSIDGLGEMDGGLLARQIMDTVVGNLARAVRKLAKIGVESFVITSDHGHQFSIRKDEDMMMDKPGGETVDQHRRCWAGRGGHTPSASVRVAGAQLGYQTDLDFIFPRGLAVFRTGGDLAFHHGGISLQEMVIPVITLRMSSTGSDVAHTSNVVLQGYPSVLTNRTFGFTIVRHEMFPIEPVPARIVLIGDGQEVGRAGMAPGAEFDRATATVQLPASKEVSIGMMLTRETSKKVRIVVQDPATDVVLAQSDEIEVGELI